MPFNEVIVLFFLVFEFKIMLIDGFFCTLYQNESYLCIGFNTKLIYV